MDSSLLNFLKNHKIFSCLDDTKINQLITKFTHVELKYNNNLFLQGNPSDAIYLIITGKLSASILTASNQNKVVGHIDEGEIIGELAVLANEPYPYTVKALRNCVLYKLEKTDFIDICYQNPTCMFETIHPVITHSHNMIQFQSTGDLHNSIVIIPANANISMCEFAKKFISIIQSDPNIILISDYLEEYATLSNTELLHEKINTVEHDKKNSQQVIYLLKSNDSPLAKIGIKNSDKIYLTTHGLSEPFIDSHVLEYISHKNNDSKSLPHLIVIHSKTTKMPKHTSQWLNLTAFSMHHHVRIDLTKHYERLLRFMRDKTTGLVLGGGGTRGWGHIGAVKAILDQELNIDFIGGTSVGAIIGGCYAMHESYEDTYKKFNKIVSTSKHSVSWLSVTIPIVSIFDSKSFTNAHVDVFENVLIEDLWIPFFCVSSNLANYSEEIHRTGLLWEKVRASSSIPGLIPPMVINGEIHFDGGLLNNLPVDIMREYIGNKGKIIAVELNSSMHDPHKYHFPPIFAFKQALATKIRINKEAYKFPRFVDIFLRGLLVGSSAKAKQNGQNATILVNLSLRKFRMLKYSIKQAEKMLEIGFLETTSQLHQYQNRHL